MDHSNEKIVIRPEDLAKPNSPAKPFTITNADVQTERARKPTRLVDDEEPLLAEIVSPTKDHSHKLPTIVWLAISLVPFLNAWIWWRHSPASPLLRNYYRVFAFLLAAISAVATVALVIYYDVVNVDGPISSSSDDWIEQLASKADRSVVRIESQPESLGTGFVIASHGTRHLILTNKHVVTNPEQCRVVLRSGHAVAGTLVGLANGDTDLALLVADTRGLRPLGPIGKFADVRTGQKVVAIGHPLGLDFTVTDGIVSAKRGGVELQTSAPISPGNSGGPLVTQDGHIVGVNTRIINPSEGQSLGFSVRADLVLETDKWTYMSDVNDLISRIQHGKNS